MILSITGALILIVLLLEVLWTTIGVGGGLLTKYLTMWLYKALRWVYWRQRSRLFLIWVGIAVFMTVFFTWVLLLWTGWTLIFSGFETAVVNAQSKAPASFWERIYFAGFTVSTLGTGDYVAQGPLWQVLAAVASLSGLFVITFTITYLVPVVQAATQARQLAVTISSLGSSPQMIVRRMWHEGDCRELSGYLQALMPDLAQIEQRHLTYPVLHYMHSLGPTESIALNVASLDEALTIVEHAMEARCGLTPAQFETPRQIITEFLYTLDKAFVDPSREAPPPPALDKLREAGLGVIDDETFADRLEPLAERRRLLCSLVEHEGWEWWRVDPPVEEEPEATEAMLETYRRDDAAND